MMTKVKHQGLVSDLMPNIKLMQMAGHFLFNYHEGKSKFRHQAVFVTCFY